MSNRQRTITSLVICVWLLLHAFTECAAQATVPVFHSLNQVGLISGDKKVAFQMQSVNGLQINRTFAGIGIGIDYYRFRSIPLFASIRQYLGRTPDQIFLYADAGTHFIWDDASIFYVPEPKRPPGLYLNAGVGFKIKAARKNAFILSAGYSYKQVTETYSSNVCPLTGGCYEMADTYRYKLNRIMVQMGWMF